MATKELLDRARNAISGIESSGRYGITGPATNGDVPLGRYQVMASNLPSWSQAALGRAVSPQEFLSSPQLQDAVFDHRFGGYLDKYGPGGAARAWFGGEGKVRGGGNVTDKLGTSVDGYERKFMNAFGGAPAQVAGNPFDQFDKASMDGADSSGSGSNPFDQFDGGNDGSFADATPQQAKGPAQPVGPDGIALKDVPGVAMKNIGSDASQIWDDAKTLGAAAVNDPKGLAKRVGDGLWGSAVSAVLPDVKAALKLAGVDPSDAEAWAKRQGAGPNPMQPVADILNKPGQVYEDLKKDVAERPVSAVANVASMAAPGAGGLGRAALKGVTGTIGLADRAFAPLVGKGLTGVSGDLQREAVQAGIAGGRQAAEFRGQLRGTAPADRVVTLANEAEDAIHQRGLADRNATIANGAGSQAGVRTSARLNTALDDARNMNRDVAGIVQNRDVEDMLGRIQGHLDTAFPHGPPDPRVLSVKGMDALKRRIGGEIDFAGPGRGPGGHVYNAVKQAITDAFPDYAPGMARAEANIGHLQQVRRQLALNSPNNATTAGKLQQAARNDAHGGYGIRREALEALRQERLELVSALAGQALGSMSPRGIAPWMLLSGGHAAGGPLGVLAQYIASIPRLHGEVRYGIGSTVRGARRVGATQKNIGNLLDALRLSADANQEN